MAEAFNSFSCQNDNFFSTAFFIFSFSFAPFVWLASENGGHAKGSIGVGRSPLPISNQYPSKTIGRVAEDGSFYRDRSVCVGDLNTLSLWLTSIHQTHPYFNECQWAITQELGIKSGKRIVERGHKLNIFPFAHLIPKIASSRLFPPLR